MSSTPKNKAPGILELVLSISLGLLTLGPLLLIVTVCVFVTVIFLVILAWTQPVFTVLLVAGIVAFAYFISGYRGN